MTSLSFRSRCQTYSELLVSQGLKVRIQESDDNISSTNGSLVINVLFPEVDSLEGKIYSSNKFIIKGSLTRRNFHPHLDPQHLRILGDDMPSILVLFYLFYRSNYGELQNSFLLPGRLFLLLDQWYHQM